MLFVISCDVSDRLCVLPLHLIREEMSLQVEGEVSLKIIRAHE